MKKLWLYLFAAVTFLLSASFATADTVTYPMAIDAVFMEVQTDRMPNTVLVTAVGINKQFEPSVSLGILPKHRVLAESDSTYNLDKQRVGHYSATLPKTMPQNDVSCDTGFIVDVGVISAA